MHVVSTHEDVGERGRTEGLHVRRFDSLCGWRAERGWRTFTLVSRVCPGSPPVSFYRYYADLAK